MAKSDDADGYTPTAGCELTKRPPLEELTAALQKLDTGCVPAPAQKIADRLAELKLLCRQQRQNEDDVALSFISMANRLRAYPDLIVFEVIAEWADKHPWYPSWADLRAMCDSRVRKVVEVRRTLVNEITWSQIRAEAGDDVAAVEALVKQRMADDKAAGNIVAAYWLERRAQAWRHQLRERELRDRDAQRQQRWQAEHTAKVAAGDVDALFE